MRKPISSKLLWALGPAALVAIAASSSPLGCANSAADCAQLGLPDGCNAGGTGASSSSTTGTGGSTTSTTGTGGSTSSTTGTGGTGGTGGSGTGGMGTGGAVCGSRFWGDPEAQAVRALATGAQATVLAGDFHGSINLGTGELTAGAAGAMFVAKLDASLAPLWAHDYAAAHLAMATDGSDNVFVAGRLNASINCGATVLDPSGGAFFLAKLDAGGSCVFGRNYNADVSRLSLAVDSTGRAVLAGGAKGTIDFGQPAPPVSKGGSDIFVAVIESNGVASSVRTFGTANDDEATGIVATASGEVFVAGTFAGKVDFGAGNGSVDSGGHVGAFVAKFNASLNTVWANHYASPSDVTVTGLVPAAPGVAVGGTFVDSITLGSSTLMNGGLFLAWIDASGTTTKPRAIAGVAAGEISAMAGHTSGAVAVAGSRNGGVYLARVESDGSAPAEVTAAGTGASHRAHAVGFGDVSTVMLGGAFDGSLAGSGSTMLTSNGGDDALLLKMCLPAP